jgi:hypothetical protein
MTMTTAAITPARAPLESPFFLEPPLEYMAAGWTAKFTVKFLYAPPVYLLAITCFRVRFHGEYTKRESTQGGASKTSRGANLIKYLHLRHSHIQRLQTTAPHDQRSKNMPHRQPQTTLDAYLAC